MRVYCRNLDTYRRGQLRRLRAEKYWTVFLDYLKGTSSTTPASNERRLRKEMGACRRGQDLKFARLARMISTRWR